MKAPQHHILPWMVLCGWLVPQGIGLAAEKPLSFSADIRPLISKYCVSCHGPDKAQREADLRLDTREGAYADLGGYSAIVSGKPDESEFYRRLITTDEDDLMPPPDAKNPLSPEDLETFRRWIAEGGAYEDHWAFAPPVRPDAPEAGNGNWTKNPIDAYHGSAQGTRIGTPTRSFP